MVGVGGKVRHRGEDSTFEGVVVSVFQKRDKKYWRCVVEDDRGLLHIYNPERLEIITWGEQSVPA